MHDDPATTPPPRITDPDDAHVGRDPLARRSPPDHRWGALAECLGLPVPACRSATTARSASRSRRPIRSIDALPCSTPVPQSLRQQELVCLTSGHVNCPRYLRGFAGGRRAADALGTRIVTPAIAGSVAVLVLAFLLSVGVRRRQRRADLDRCRRARAVRRVLGAVETLADRRPPPPSRSTPSPAPTPVVDARADRDADARRRSRVRRPTPTRPHPTPAPTSTPERHRPRPAPTASRMKLLTAVPEQAELLHLPSARATTCTASPTTSACPSRRSRPGTRGRRAASRSVASSGSRRRRARPARSPEPRPARRPRGHRDRRPPAAAQPGVAC